MEMAKLTSKGQITIPKAVRDALGVDCGDKVVFVKTANGFLMCNGESVVLSAPVVADAAVAADEEEVISFAEPRPSEKSGEGKKKKKKKKKKD
ncbi:MAG: AbrB/MazE/SpoVT family DNA-binding domain-containing protein [Candidatus Coproplasma sp.]